MVVASSQSNAVGTGGWELTAPESWVLLNGPKAGSQPLKLGLTELMTRGALKLVESKGRFGGKTVLLTDGPRADAPNEPPLRSLWELYRSGSPATTPEGTGVPIDRLVRAARSTFGSVGGYVHRAVLPSLLERGLFEKKQARVLFVFPKTTYELTPAGRARRAELEGLLARGRERFGGWVDDDPAAAVAYVGTAGAAVLLAPTLFPEMRRLHQQTDTAFATTSLDLDDDAASPIDLALSAFDILDSAADAIDSSVDASDGGSDGGGSDGGGDGGGGDGGGSGD